MGAADDIKKGLTKNLANFTKQRKAEEKHISAGRWRMSRMTEVRGVYLAEAANEVMAECYAKASDNGRLPATARQIYYVARPLIEERTDKPLNYAYFSQTLLPNYVEEHGGGWDVVYDDRGHFAEPHIKRVIGLGTLNVRGYVALRRRYSVRMHNNGRLFLSQRMAEKELNSHHNQIARWYRELQHYGFIVLQVPGCLGVDGKGKAPHWRLTELGYMKELPTRDFTRWDGAPFKDRKKQRAQKLESRARKHAHPVRENTHTSVLQFTHAKEPDRA